MMVGVISDSHDNISNVRKALRVFSSKNVDAIIHLGDIVSPFTLKEVCSTGMKVYSVFGNNCGEKKLLLETAAKCGAVLSDPPLELELGSKEERRLLLLHGFGSRELTLKIVRIIAASGEYDAVLYGHTHLPHLEKIGKTLVLNPGEVLGYLTGKPSVALLDLDALDARIVNLD